MRGSRVIAAVAGLVGWIYSWSVIRNVRSEFAFGDLGQIPFWLLLLMGGASTLLIGSALAAAMGAPLWPLLAALAGPAFFLLIVLAQFAVMRHPNITRQVTLSEALAASLQVRSVVSVAVFVAGIPTALVLSALTWTLRSRMSAEGGQRA